MDEIILFKMSHLNYIDFWLLRELLGHVVQIMLKSMTNKHNSHNSLAFPIFFPNFYCLDYPSVF